jgi:hypothetical protein
LDRDGHRALAWGLASGVGFGIAEGVLHAGTFCNGIGGPGVYLVRFLSWVALHAVGTGSVGLTLHRGRAWFEGVQRWYQ